MTKRAGSVTIDYEIVLIDDLWCVIGSLIPWHDVDTLISFARVSRDAIRWIQPSLKSLLQCLTLNYRTVGDRNITRAERRALQEDAILFYLGVKRIIYDHSADLNHRIYDAVEAYNRCTSKTTTQEELNKWGRTLLSIAHYFHVSNKYIYSREPNKTNFGKLGPTIPANAFLSHIFYSDTRTGTLDYLYLRENVMSIEKGDEHTDTSTVSIEELSPSMKEVIHIALGRKKGNYRTAIFHHLLCDRLPHRKAEIHDALTSVVVKIDDKDYLSIYSGHEAVNKVREKCFYYRGCIEDANKAFYLQNHDDAHIDEIEDLCQGIGHDRIMRDYSNESISESSEEISV